MSTDDIVTRLREDAKNLEDRLAFSEARRHTEVADEIERLRLDRDRWRLASITFANMAEDNGVSSREIYQSIWETVKKGSAQ